ncbi:unnamed protein product [Paramecium primaurelia]|uniref:Uncharacterized protein n=1 Tax=Paramecium primaurelia TaxID=5886 RepID=A0A8S1L763_PARPR|nr:unnamed protein product [Paramecium primaurelia]
MFEDDKDRKLKQANDNVKYLESQLTPLVESNSKLKESIHALQYYMEQRRLDFAQLLSYKKERHLQINLSDMVDVYEWLKKDIENYLEQIQELETENKMFKLFIQQQDEETRNEIGKLNATILKQEHTIKKQLEQFNLEQKKNQDHQLTLKLEYDKKLENQEIKFRDLIQLIENEKDEISKKYQQLDDEYQQKLKKQKLELINQFDKQERQNQTEFSKQLKELNDQIQKLDIKNRQLLTEMQNVKQDNGLLAQQCSSQQKNITKLNRQVENLLQTLKNNRDEISTLNLEKTNLLNLIDSLKIQIEKQNKKEIELQQYIKNQRDQYIEQQTKFENQISEQEITIKEINSQLGKKELCIKELSDMNVKIDKTYQDRLNKQRIKYEQLLYPNRFINTDQLLYKETMIQHDDTLIKEVIEDYELMLSQYANQLESQTIKLQSLENSFQEKQNALKLQFDQKVAKLAKDYEQKFLRESKQQKLQIEELHLLKQKELEAQKIKQSNEIEKLNVEFENKTQHYVNQIQNLQNQSNEDAKIIDQLNQLIIQLQDNTYELKQSHEQQLEMLRNNHQIGKQQLTVAFEERFNKVNDELKKLQLEKDNFELIRIQDQKVLNEIKKKNDVQQTIIIQIKEESKQQQQVISEQVFMMEQYQQQIQRLNDGIKQLQQEVENSKQVYNIFRNQPTIMHRQSDDSHYKSDIKKSTNTQFKFSRTKQVTRQSNRPALHNTSTTFIIQNGEQSQLPKVRSISTNQIRTTPRHHSSQV